MADIPQHLRGTLGAIGIAWTLLAVSLALVIAWRIRTGPADVLPSRGFATALLLVLGHLFVGALLSDVLDALFGPCILLGGVNGVLSGLLVLRAHRRKRHRMRARAEDERGHGN